MTNASKIEVLPATSATDSQHLAYLKAAFSGGTLGTNTFTVKAYGKKPSEDIPIIVIVRGEI